ncbi:MAG: AAA family ATPase, partial [Desulfobacterales bacterium]|nr:AAA family ATPase [Desulfobacterales bacterium]
MDNALSEQEKAGQFLDEVERLWPTNQELVASRQFFEIWERSCEPRPFSIVGSRVTLGGREARLPKKKEEYIAWLSWDYAEEAPALIAETGKTQYRLRIRVRDGRIRFEGAGAVSLEREEDGYGEQIEVIYDVIDYILAHHPGVNVLKLKKKEFTDALDNLPLKHDGKLLKRMARLPVSRIKKLTAWAASDMAIDDLSMQLSLPLGGSYALDSGGRAPESGEPGPGIVEIPRKTHWEITREIELLAAMARCNHEAEKQFTLPLDHCEIIRTDEAENIFIKIPDVIDTPLREGDRLTVHEHGERESLGVFFISMFDYDTIYGELHLENPGDLKRLQTLRLQPKKTPHRFMTRVTENLYHLVKDQPEKIAGALGFVLGLKKARFVRDSWPGPDPEMDFSQEEAWRASVNPDNRVVAVQGPPGAGKTWVLARVLQQLCERGERILVTAPSNTAVDNICRSASHLPVLRFGAPEKIHPDVLGSCWFGDEENVDAFLDKQDAAAGGAVFAATHVRALLDKEITMDLQENGLFDAIIFDETGMSRVDEFLLCAQLGRRVIVFGDQRQLPPFPLSSEVLGKLAREHPLTTSGAREVIHLSALE